MPSSADLHDRCLRIETFVDGHVTRIVLHGEADSACAGHLEAALADIERDGSGSVELHVSDLGFVDVAALRRLTLYARALRQAGCHVETHGAQPLLAELVRLTGVREDLGLV